MNLRLDRCTLRAWRAGDLETLVANADDPLIAGNLRDLFPHPYTRDAGRLWLQAVVSAATGTRWAIDVDGAAVGGIGLELKEREERRTAEIGYWLGRAFWGRGIMTEAVGAVTRHAFASFDIARIEANVFGGNSASVRVLEKNGYILEGRLRQRIVKNGRLMDQLVFARLAP